MKNIKYKKLYISLLIIIVISITYGILYIRETEAPIKNDDILIKEISEQIKEESPTINEIPDRPIEKYKIINRSVLVREDKKNTDKFVLLTIDDGPTPRTLKIIEILKAHNAKAIFFINGINSEKNKGVLKAIYDEGFIVGNHGWSHMNLKKQENVSTVQNEIIKTSKVIEQNTGELPKFFRAPYGESNSSIRKFVKDNEMIFMDWSGAAMDWDKSTVDPNIFIGNVMKNIHSGSIILIHEHPWSVANIDALLTTIESKGYTYVDPNNIVEY